MDNVSTIDVTPILKEQYAGSSKKKPNKKDSFKKIKSVLKK